MARGGRLRSLAAAMGVMASAGGLPAQEAATLRGVVFDSTAMRPLAGARVELLALPARGIPQVATSGPDGRYAFGALPLGTYVLAFGHPRLDSLGVEPALVRVALRVGGTVTAPLTVPSARTVARTTCHRDPRTDSTGVWRGFVRSSRDGLPVGGATLRLSWPEFELDAARGLRRTSRVIEARTGETGRFLVCGVPIGSVVLARAQFGGEASGEVELEVPGDGVLLRDLLVGGAPGAGDATATDPRPVGVPSPGAPAAATARVRGAVRDASGAGIAGARVGLLGDSVVATTDAGGRFALAASASGTRTLEARALGYQPGRRAVDIVHGADAALDVVLLAAPVAGGGASLLDTTRVVGAATIAEGARRVREGFQRRMQAGVGIFLPDSVIHARARHLPSELFRGLPGVTVTSGSGGQGVYLRVNATFTASKGLCLPTIFLDGTRAPGAPLDQLTIVADLRAVEVYQRSELAPSQFQSADGCGVIVVWTRSSWEAR